MQLTLSNVFVKSIYCVIKNKLYDVGFYGDIVCIGRWDHMTIAFKGVCHLAAHYVFPRIVSLCEPLNAIKVLFEPATIFYINTFSVFESCSHQVRY